MLGSGMQIYGGRYTILRPLGQGGMSNIYICQDRQGQQWVMKEMTAHFPDAQDQAQAERQFSQEFTLLRQLMEVHHPNLPKVLDFFRDVGRAFMVMEYVQGEDLAKLVARVPRPLPESQVVDYAIQLCSVLYFLHMYTDRDPKSPDYGKRKPIIFRDLKPSNVMITPQVDPKTGNNVIKLIDFGIVRFFKQEKSHARKGDTLRIGSPGYAPPEQYTDSEQTDPRSDIYSLGVTIHHMLTKWDPANTQTPFKLPPVASFNGAVSPGLTAIIGKATQVDREQRYGTALEMKKELQALLNPQPPPRDRTIVVDSSRIPAGSPPPAPASRQPAQAGTAHPSSAAHQPPKPFQKQIPAPQQSQQARAMSRPAPARPLIGAPAAQRQGSGIVALLVVIAVIGVSLFFGRGYIADAVNLPADVSVEELLNPFSLGPGRSPFDARLEKLMKEKDWQGAMAFLNRHLETAPNDIRARILLNNCFALAARAGTVTVLVFTKDDTDPFLQGVFTAQRQVNGKGGVQGHKAIVLPHRGSELPALAKLAKKTGAVAAILAPSVQPPAKPAGIPVIAAGSTAREAPLFGLAFPPDFGTAQLCRFLLKERQITRPGLVVPADGGGCDPAQVASLFGAVPLRVERLAADDPRVEEVLRKWLGERIDALILGGNLQQLPLRRLKTLPVSARALLPGSDADRLPLTELAGFFRAECFDLLADSPQTTGFLSTFSSAFGRGPSPEASCGYDTLTLTLRALEKGDIASDTVQETLSMLGGDAPFRGVTGDYFFRGAGSPGPRAFLYECVGGKWKQRTLWQGGDT